MVFEGQTVLETRRLVVISCAKCHMLFGIPVEFQTRKRNDNTGFYCPEGHSNIYRTNEIDRLRKALEAKAADVVYFKDRVAESIKERDHARHQLRGTKAVLARTKRRIANGVCPCCKRSFADLSRHMTGQHPGYAAPEPAAD